MLVYDENDTDFKVLKYVFGFVYVASEKYFYFSQKYQFNDSDLQATFDKTSFRR